MVELEKSEQNSLNFIYSSSIYKKSIKEEGNRLATIQVKASEFDLFLTEIESMGASLNILEVKEEETFYLGKNCETYKISAYTNLEMKGNIPLFKKYKVGLVWSRIAQIEGQVLKHIFTVSNLMKIKELLFDKRKKSNFEFVIKAFGITRVLINNKGIDYFQEKVFDNSLDYCPVGEREYLKSWTKLKSLLKKVEIVGS